MREPFLPGQSLLARLGELSTARRLMVLVAVARQLRKINRRGVAHRDLRLDNVMISPTGGVCLVDFDRARMMSPGAALCADWLGVGPGGPVSKPFWKLAIYTLVPRAQSLGQRIRTTLRHGRAVVLPPDAGLDVRLLGEAWELAARSPANAPGQDLAYYSFTYRGTHFPGERPWPLRWEAIRAWRSW